MCLPTALGKINLKKRDAPAELLEAIDNKDFNALWRFDFKSLNVRHTIHKYQYNHWAVSCTHASDGLWCAWDISEMIDDGVNNVSDTFAKEKAEVRSQLYQVASMFGWDATEDTGSTDTVFEFVYEKIDGVETGEVSEPL